MSDKEVSTAEGEQLDALGELVGVERQPSESDDDFRTRVQTAMEDVTHSRHTHRTHQDIIEMVESVCRQNVDGEWDESVVRNAGDILVYETELRLVLRVPLPYFHQAGIEPDDIQRVIKNRFPPTCRVEVEVAPPPSQREQ